MPRKHFILILFLLAGMFLFQCSRKESTKIEVISISITDAKTVLLNDNRVLIVDLAEKLNEFDKSSKVEILPKNTTKMGTYNEVYKLIRAKGFSNIENQQPEELATKEIE